MGKELGLFYVSQGYKVSDGGPERRLSINKYSFELLFKYGIFLPQKVIPFPPWKVWTENSELRCC